MLNKRFVAKTVLIIGVICLVSVPVSAQVPAQDLETVPGTIDPLDGIAQQVQQRAALQDAGVGSVPEEFQSLTADEIRAMIAQIEAQQAEDERNGVQDEEKKNKQGADLSILQALLAGGGSGGQGGGGQGGGGSGGSGQGGGLGSGSGSTSGSNSTVGPSKSGSGPGQTQSVAAGRSAIESDVLRSTRGKIVSANGQLTDGEVVESHLLDSEVPLEFRGTRSSILFDQQASATEASRRRKNLPLDIYGFGDTTFMNNLSVDDELFKTSWSQFQSKDYVQRSFVQDAKARDRYLDSFDSARGVAHLTLSYLDKTVAAGLSTVQQQADMDYTHQLLKQVSWSTARVANPNRDSTFYDVDEKFEACMMEFGHKLVVPNGIQKENRSEALQRVQHVKYRSCQTKCSAIADPNASPYHFCTCCAELGEEVNTSAGNTGESLVCDGGKQCYSLVERVFFGLKAPTSGRNVTVGKGRDAHNAFDGGASMIDFANQFRSLYGDIVMVPHQQSKGDYKQSYVYPYYSPSTWIKLVRDFETMKESYGDLQNCTEARRYGSVATVVYCPIIGKTLQYGICPAMWRLVGFRKNNEIWGEQIRNNKQQLHDMIVEASLGGLVDNGDILHFASIDSKIELDKSKVDINDPTLVAAVNTFCDKSAVSFFKRIHLKMVSVALDHMLLNQKATQHEKDQIINLMNRVSSYLDLASSDNESLTRSMLVGLSVQSDTNRMVTSSTLESMFTANSNNNANALGGFAGPGFGGGAS